MKNIRKNVAFHNLGCKVNAYELDVVQQKFEKKNYQIVPFDQNADIYVINTCTVTNIADRKSRQMLHQAKKRNPDAIVVALGCYVQTDKEKVDMDPCIDLAIGNNRKKDTVEIVEDYLRTKNHPEDAVIDINHTDEYEEMQLEKAGEHTRAYIKIQDGCNQFCTYCIIPYARGRVRSRQVEDICEEIKGLTERGYREFVLTGIHISSYGVDFTKASETDSQPQEEKGAFYWKGRSRLQDLIEMIHQLPGVERIRLGSLEPRIVTEDFAEGLSKLPKLCPHFHLSLQSGCDETLKRMNRQYTTEEFRQGVDYLRQYFQNPAITTDVIAGFPGETEEEFAQTKDFLKEIGFFEMHVFPYSVRKGTVAAKMPGQLSADEKKERARQLIELDTVQSKEYRRSFKGKEVWVLWEEAKEISGQWYMIGHTKEYIRVALPISDLHEEKKWSGQIVQGTPGEMLTEEIMILNHCNFC